MVTFVNCPSKQNQVRTNPPLINWIHRSEKTPPLSLLTPEDLLHADDARDELNLDMNILKLYPDPIRFVRFLKDIDRIDISSDLFVKLLEVYHNNKSQDAGDPMQFVLHTISYSLAAFIHALQDTPLPANYYTDANSAVGRKLIVKYTLQTCAFIIFH